VLAHDPREAAYTERIHALEGELRLLEPYASTAGLAKLKQRVREIRAALHRLRGLPLDPADDA